MKNSDLLTFFQPGEPAGTTWTFAVQVGDGIFNEVWMFARGKVELSQLAATSVPSEEDYKNLLKEILAAIQPEGGILVYARTHNDVDRVQTVRVESPGYALPKQVLRLGPSGDARFEDISSSTDLEVGDHLLLPVSAEAERRLRSLSQDLKGLPPDLESSVLNIIRRPSLEWRIQRIERTLSVPPATRAEQQRRRVGKGAWWEKLRGIIIRPIPAWTAVVAALLLMVGTLFAYESFHPLNQVSKKKAEMETTPGTVTVKKPTPEPKETPKIEPEDLKASLDNLFKALSTADDQSVRGLYESHFKDHQKDALKSPDVSWGITKLQALELGFIDKNHPQFRLSDRLAWSDTEKVYRDERNLSILKENTDAVDLLAYTWCQQTNAPNLPVTPKYKDPLPLKGACGDVKPDDAVPGLEALTDWVNKQKK